MEEGEGGEGEEGTRERVVSCFLHPPDNILYHCVPTMR